MNSDFTGIVKFGAEWCGPCKMIAPLLSELTQQEEVAYLEVDIDEQPELAQSYSVRAVPTTLAFKNGQVVGSLVGAKMKSELLKLIEKVK